MKTIGTAPFPTVFSKKVSETIFAIIWDTVTSGGMLMGITVVLGHAKRPDIWIVGVVTAFIVTSNCNTSYT
jgi:hypothetical protein